MALLIRGRREFLSEGIMPQKRNHARALLSQLYGCPPWVLCHEHRRLNRGARLCERRRRVLRGRQSGVDRELLSLKAIVVNVAEKSEQDFRQARLREARLWRRARTRPVELGHADSRRPRQQDWRMIPLAIRTQNSKIARDRRSKQGDFMIFEGLREIVGAYRPDPTTGNQQIDDAVRFLTSLRGGPGALGFFGRESSSDAVSDREARFFTICSSYAPILNQRREISR